MGNVCGAFYSISGAILVVFNVGKMYLFWLPRRIFYLTWLFFFLHFLEKIKPPDIFPGFKWSANQEDMQSTFGFIKTGNKQLYGHLFSRAFENMRYKIFIFSSHLKRLQFMTHNIFQKIKKIFQSMSFFPFGDAYNFDRDVSTIGCIKRSRDLPWSRD